MSTKLTIKTYSNEEFTAEKGEYVVTINPQNLRIKNDIDYNSSRMPYNNNWNFKYNCTLPRQLSFSLLFDNTGIFPNTKINVKKQIEDLEGLIYNCKEDIKQPHFIRVIWGNIDFQGRLLKMQTEYGMFKNNGDIIRAQTDIVIIEQKPINNAVASQKGVDEDKKEDQSASTNNTTKTENNDKNKKAENKIKEEKKEQSNEEVQNKAAKEKEDVKKENEDVESKDNHEEVEKEDDTISEEEKEVEENSVEEEQNDLKEEEKKESETEEESTEKKEEDKTNEEEIDEENEETMVKSGDTLPSATKECLISSGIYPSSSMLNNLLSKAASFNLLNSLKDLVLGSIFFMPKKIITLLKALFRKLANLLKRGATYIKTGAKKGINKISSVGKKIISKVRN